MTASDACTQTGFDSRLRWRLGSADRSRVHPETVRRWLRTGSLRGTRLGPGTGSASYRIPARELDRFRAGERGGMDDHRRMPRPSEPLALRPADAGKLIGISRTEV